MFLLLLGRWSWSVLQHNNETKVLMRGEGSRGTDNNFTKYIDHGMAWYSLKVVRVKCNNGIKNGFLKSIKKIYQELCFILIFLLYYIDLDNTRVLQYIADLTMVRTLHIWLDNIYIVLSSSEVSWLPSSSSSLWMESLAAHSEDFLWTTLSLDRLHRNWNKEREKECYCTYCRAPARCS